MTSRDNLESKLESRIAELKSENAQLRKQVADMESAWRKRADALQDLAALRDAETRILRGQLSEANELKGQLETAKQNALAISGFWDSDLDVMAALEAEFTAARRVCGQIRDIMRVYREQAASRYGVDTPGGLEHMGDVWALLGKWDEMIGSTIDAAAAKEPK